LRTEISALPHRVTWIPGLPPDDPALPGAFRASEIFALSSCHEPFGIVILEAWAASLPVVATRVGGIPGFTTPEENILLVDEGDAPALSAALLRLAQDPGLARHLAENGALLATERYDWPAIAKTLLSLYPQKV
jgi:glycosyltransferase involved in cell wall biosynthesis